MFSVHSLHLLLRAARCNPQLCWVLPPAQQSAWRQEWRQRAFAACVAVGGSHSLRMHCLNRPHGHAAAHRRGAVSTTARALHHGPGLPDWLNPARIGAAVLASILSASACSAEASQWPTHVASEQLYEQQLQRRKPSAVSNLPTSREARAMRGYDRDLFTPDAWEGMLRLQQYAEYIEGIAEAGAESAPGCEACTANRLMLEKAWQVVANEYYDSHAAFSQAAWATALQDTLKAHGGVLRTTGDTYAALSQLMSCLHDPYSTFLPPSQFRQALRRPQRAERNYLEAQYVGVGLHFGELTAAGGRLIAAPMAESPAEAAGLQRGDEVLEVEGIPATQLTMDETTTLLRGPAGSSVELVVQQRGRTRRLLLERQRLPQPPLKEARLPLPDGRRIAYLRLHYFSGEGTAALKRAVVAGEEDGVAGYVLDLRNNPGGVFEEAVAAASLFLEPAQRVAQTVRSGGVQGQPAVIDTTWTAGSFSAEAYTQEALAVPGPLTNRPLVLLVNRSSASASEVLAGALHDHGRAVLLGERTFGKGVVQYYFPLADGSGLKLTVAKYLTPKQYDIVRNGGLAPDTLCRDYPHGVFTKGTADRCVLGALSYLQTAPPGLDLSAIDPLYASR